MYSEANIQKAISALKKAAYQSLRKAANVFSVSNATLCSRMSGRTSRAAVHESEQILSTAEAKALARWITLLSPAGSPASLLWP